MATAQHIDKISDATRLGAAANSPSSPTNFFSGQFFPIVSITLAMILALVFVFVAWRNRRYFILPSKPSTPVHYRILSNNEESLNNLVVSDSENDDEIR